MKVIFVFGQAFSHAGIRFFCHRFWIFTSPPEAKVKPSVPVGQVNAAGVVPPDEPAAADVPAGPDVPDAPAAPDEAEPAGADEPDPAPLDALIAGLLVSAPEVTCLEPPQATRASANAATPGVRRAFFRMTRVLPISGVLPNGAFTTLQPVDDCLTPATCLDG